MDGVSSAFAVVSLAIQLVETGQKISSFLTSIEDAPSEISKLVQSVDQLNGTLKQVSSLLEQQYLVLRLPGSPVFITNALENCEKRMKTLESVISKARIAMDHRNRVHRSWAAIKFSWKKEYVREMQKQLRDAEAGLRTAMLCNSWQLQMHSISISSYSDLQATTIEQPPLANPIQSIPRYETLPKQCSTHKDTLRANIKKTHSLWYRGYFGSVDIQVKSTSLDTFKSRRTGNRAISEEKTIKITPAFLRKTLELRLLSSFGQISRTLRTYSILEDSAPVFTMCQNGDLRGLQAALSSGTVSPFVVTELWGLSLLHCAAAGGSLDTCALLLQLGADPHFTDISGTKAFCDVNSQRTAVADKGETVEILRILTQSRDGISAQDIHFFWMMCCGMPVEGAEFMRSQDMIQSESDVSDDEDVFPFLATALREFARDPSQWDSFVRLQVRKNADLHSPVPRYTSAEYDELFDPMFPCRVLKYGTLLDDLLMYTSTPFEGETAANHWLQVLSSEGFDLVAYLEKEFALHAEQMQLIRPSCRQFYASDVPRQLIYRWGSNPSVSWDWWIDPNSCAYLVRKEFRHMELVCNRQISQWDEWERLWPLRYPAWSDHRKPYELLDTRSERQPLYDLAQKRANRRWEKKSMKAARAQGLKKRDRMPGAWPV